METKVLRDAFVKAVTPTADEGEDAHIYEGVFSVFKNVDHYGDVVQKGAFADSLAEWKKSGQPIPVYYAHQMSDPNMLIGQVVDAAEVEPGDKRLEGSTTAAKTNGGLWARVQLDKGYPVADKVYSDIKKGRLRQSSFSYDVIDGSYKSEVVDGEEKSYFSLDKMKLLELGPCPLGVNDQTDVVAVKARQAKMKAVAAPEADDDPSKLVASLDAVLDEAVKLVAGVDTSALPPEVAQALDLLTGAEELADQVMELLGITDPDEDDAAKNREAPNKAVTSSSEADQSATTVVPDAPRASAEGMRLLIDFELGDINVD